jgi:hypothetical protein
MATGLILAIVGERKRTVTKKMRREKWGFLIVTWGCPVEKVGNAVS